MIELGKKQKLSIVKKVEFGAYLGTEEEKVLLPIKQLPEEAQIGDEIEVKVADMAVYKGNNAEPYSAIWKEILFEAVMGKYSYIDYGYSKK